MPDFFRATDSSNGNPVLCWMEDDDLHILDLLDCSRTVLEKPYLSDCHLAGIDYESTEDAMILNNKRYPK